MRITSRRTTAAVLAASVLALAGCVEGVRDGSPGEGDLSVSDGSPPNIGADRVHWDNLTGVPTDIADGSDAGMSYNAGSGITLIPAGASTTINVQFAGTGATPSAARADHNHSATYVDTGGDAMTGPLTLSGDPSSNMQAATKQYVDNNIATAGGGDITGVTAGAGLAGGGSLGDVTLNANFGGNGSALTLSRSDHNHDAVYHTQTTLETPGVINDSANPVDWTNLKNVPADFADGTDDTAAVLAGTGIDITGGVISVDLATSDGTPPNSGSNIVHWDNMTGVPTGTTDGDYMIWNQSMLRWIISSPAGGGDITGVNSGAGLTGGGASGTVTLDVDFAGTGLLGTVARSDHDHDADYVQLAGDTMLGDLTLPADPTAALHAATKQYVDNSVLAGAGGQVDSVVAGNGITVDDADPANPIVAITDGVGAGDVLEWDGSAWISGVDSVDDADADATNELNASVTWTDATDTLAVTDAGGALSAVITGFSDSTHNHDADYVNVASDTMTGQLTSTVATGTAPFVVASTTVVTNLNSDLLDGQEGAYYLDWGNLTAVPAGIADGTDDVDDADADATNELNASVTWTDATDTLAVTDAGGALSAVITGFSDSTHNHDADYVNVASDTMTGQLTSTVATGTAPFVVASTTVVTNLNSDLLDGQEGAYYLDWANLTSIPAGISDGDDVDGGDALTLNTLDSSQFLRSDTSSALTSGTLTINTGTTIQLDGTVRVGQDSSSDDDYMYFDHSSSPEYLMWKDAISYFELSDDINVVGEIYATAFIDSDAAGTCYIDPGAAMGLSLYGDATVGMGSMADDDFIYFDQSQNEHLVWRDSTDRFEFSNDLHTADNLYGAMLLDSDNALFYVDPALTSEMNTIIVDTLNVANVTKSGTGIVTNLNADLLDGQDGLYYRNASNINAGTLDEARIPAAIARDSEIMTTILANDGPGSTIDADSVDGLSGAMLLPLSGGIMTGALTLSGAPTGNLHAATKLYVDDSIAGASGGDITEVNTNAPLSGGATTGAVTLSISQATGSTDGYLSSVDWSTFNSKLGSEADTLQSVCTRGSSYTGTATFQTSLLTPAIAPLAGESSDLTISTNDGTFVTGDLTIKTGHCEENAGDIMLNTGGGGAGAGTGGDIFLSTGHGCVSGDGGSISVSSGNGGSPGNGGSITLNTGSGGAPGEPGAISFGVGGTERMRVHTDGNVGIGTNTPASTLDVNGTARVTGLQLTTSPTDGHVLTSDASGNATWQAPTPSAGLVPVGGIVAWLKSYTNTPALSAQFAECNGQVLSDASSPYNGLTLPDLNGGSRYLKGSATSGTTGGASTHSHVALYTTTDGGVELSHTPSGNSNFWGDGTLVDNVPPDTFNTGSSSSEPPHYEVVWVMRVK